MKANNRYKSHTIKPLNSFPNSETFSNSYSNSSNFKEDNKNETTLLIYETVLKMNNRLDSLEARNKNLYRELNETKTRENKVLNRFSYLILIIDIIMTVVFAISVIVFFDSLYPFLKKIMEDSFGIKCIVTAVGGILATGISGLWWTFNKYVSQVINREKNLNKK